MLRFYLVRSQTFSHPFLSCLNHHAFAVKKDTYFPYGSSCFSCIAVLCSPMFCLVKNFLETDDFLQQRHACVLFLSVRGFQFRWMHSVGRNGLEWRNNEEHGKEERATC
jgi:hypothetical protein